MVIMVMLGAIVVMFINGGYSSISQYSMVVLVTMMRVVVCGCVIIAVVVDIGDDCGDCCMM